MHVKGKGTSIHKVERARWKEVAGQFAPLAARDVLEQVERNGLLRALLGRVASVQGQRVLDCGAGTGALSWYLALRGAEVFAFDLANEMVRLAVRKRPDSPSTARRPKFVVAAFEALPYPNETFDCVVGSHILHHAETALAVQEVYRVLKVGGRAIFVETWGQNPLLRLARRYLAGRFGIARYGTVTEHPLTWRDVKWMQQLFHDVRVTFPVFVCFAKAAANVFRWQPAARPFTRALVSLDAWLEQHLSVCKPWSYYCLIELQK